MLQVKKYIIILFSGGEWRLERHSETCLKGTFSARGRLSNPVWPRYSHLTTPVLFQIFSDGTNIISRRLPASCWRSCTDSPRSRWRSSTVTMTGTSISPSRRRGRGCGHTGTSSRWTQSDWITISAANRLIGKVVQSRRRPLLGPSPGWKRLLALSHLRHY